jgi:EamA domain-containing membrane protein RarD
LALGYVAIIRSVKTVMLFSCLAYLAFGLMYAYEEVLKETRNDVMPQMSLEVPFTA